jgi:hypothetical protein
MVKLSSSLDSSVSVISSFKWGSTFGRGVPIEETNPTQQASRLYVVRGPSTCWSSSGA